MNFKVGDIVKTRDGREVEILKTDAPCIHPILGMYLESGYADNWNADGTYFGPEERNCDLLPPKRTRDVTVWVNVYPTTDRIPHTVHDNPEAADRAADYAEALAVAVPVTFTVEW